MVTTCPYCECVFSYEKEDIQYGDQRDPYKEVICPCCTQAIDLYKQNQEDGSYDIG